MLWIKAFHIIFMVTWFAGLFYLPRLFVYHTGASDRPSHERFVIMERKLLIIMTLGAALTAFFGAWLLLKMPALLQTGWLQVKLIAVASLLAYHGHCALLVRDFARNSNRHSEKWYRFYNEVPALALVAIVLLAVLKPF